MVDSVIVGSGPAALTAALYLARAGYQPQVFERGEIGGAITQTDHIANYPGFEGAGKDLAAKLRAQAEQAGAEITYGECRQIRRLEDGSYELRVDDETLTARTVLVATGSEPRQLGFELEVPVSYCALCDADLAKDKRVAVVGGANGAVKEGIYLAKLVRELTIVSHSKLKADQVLIDELEKLENVKVLEDTEPTAELLNSFGYVFVFIGKQPATGCLKGLASDHELFDEQGFVKTGGAGRTAHETAATGVFAAGDVRSGAVRQIITAAGDGAAAATEMVTYLKK